MPNIRHKINSAPILGVGYVVYVPSAGGGMTWYIVNETAPAGAMLETSTIDAAPDIAIAVQAWKIVHYKSMRLDEYLSMMFEIPIVEIPEKNIDI